MATLKHVSKDTLLQIARYMDEVVDEEEVWRAFIDQMGRRIYTEAQIETFAEENLKTRGSPSLSLLSDLKQRSMLLEEFLEIMRRVKCTKVLNLFVQTTVPEIIEEPKRTVTVMKGDDLTLRCKAQCKPPPPSYLWYWKDVPLHNQDSSILKIYNVNVSHSGHYHCVVTNPCLDNPNLCSVTSKYSLVEVLNRPIPETASEELPMSFETVTDDDRLRSESVASISSRSGIPSTQVLNTPGQEDIAITLQPKDLECRYNEHFELKCAAHSVSGRRLTFEWMREKLGPLNEEVITCDGSSVLRKKHSEADHLCIYCVVSSEDGKYKVYSDKVKVTVKSVWIEEEPRNFDGYIGDFGMLECKAAGKGDIQYRWFKNENGKKTIVPCSNKEDGILYFLSLTAENWGDYSCQAENMEDFATSKSVMLTCKPFVEQVCITVNPKSHVCLRGESSIALHCEAISSSNITYQWYKDDNILLSEKQDMLQLSPTTKNDFGHYHCVVSSMGKAVTSRKAEVVEGLPFITTESLNKTQADQRDAEYTFQTAGNMLYAREKIALLIGNQTYAREIKSLSSSHNDIKHLSETLKSLGFKVLAFSDLCFEEIMRILKAFCKSLDSGVYCVFYYSGHGFNYQNVDYIMPTDVSLPITCDYCISTDLIANHLQMTKSKVFMFLDCCRVNYDTDRVKGPTKHFVNQCGFANIYKLWSCSVSKPAYERISEECSVFNTALRNALSEKTEAENLNAKILEYMQKNGLTKDGKEFQRPIALLNFSPPKLTLHEKILFDDKTKQSVQDYEELHSRLHSIPSCKISPSDLPGLASGDVTYEFVMSNVLHIIIELIVLKPQFQHEDVVTVNPELESQGLHVSILKKPEKFMSRITYEVDISALQKLKSVPDKLFTITVSASDGKHHFSPPVNLELKHF